MRAAIGTGVAAIAVVASAYAVLLVSDSAAPRPAVPQATAAPAAAEPVPERQPLLYMTHDSVVPLGRQTLELPILMYHYIRVPPSPRIDYIGYKLSVAPAVFAAQMDWLADHGYHTVTFDDLRRYWQRVTPLPAKPVIVTLDDGYQDLFTAAYPILQAHGFAAVAYIVSGFVGQPGYVTAAEVVEMDRHGIEIGAHTVNHANLARTSDPWLTYQVAESKAWLEKLVGHTVVDMAYPSGQFNARVVASVQRAGYWSGVTEQSSVAHSPADRLVWGRVRVVGGETMETFIANLGTAMPTVTTSHIVRVTTIADLHHLS